MTRAEVATEKLDAQLKICVELYAEAVERALAASADGQLLTLEAIDQLVRLEARCAMLYALLGVVADRAEKGEL